VGRTIVGVADGQRSGVHIASAATVLPWSGRDLLYPAGDTTEQRPHRILQQPATEGVPEPELLDEPARGEGGDRGLQGRPQPPAPPLVAELPHPVLGVPPACGGVRCEMAATPTNRWMASRSTDINQNRLQNDVVRLSGTCQDLYNETTRNRLLRGDYLRFTHEVADATHQS